MTWHHRVVRLGSPRDAMTGATASRTIDRAPVVVTARAATSGPPIVAPIVAPIVTMIVTMIAAMVATMTAPTAAWAAACSHDLIELHAERRASVREQLARARPVLATIEFIPRPAAAAPGEHLRMLRVARADARAPQARAELELAYARALLAAREHLTARHDAHYAAIYDAEERGQTARARALSTRRMSYESRRRALDGQLIALLQTAVAQGDAAASPVDPQLLLELGLARARAGEPARAAAALERISRAGAPLETWLFAQLMIGDARAEQGEPDGALRRYRAAARAAAGLTRALALDRVARLKLSQGHDPSGSLSAFVSALEDARGDDERTERLARQLRRDARRDLPRAFALARPPRGALDQLRRWGAGPEPREDMVRRMGLTLADSYLAAGRAEASSEVYRQLASAFPDDPDRCRWRGLIVANSYASGDADRQRRELEALLDLSRALDQAPVRPTVRDDCRAAALAYTATLARAWHERAIQERSAALRRHAAAAYLAFALLRPGSSAAASMMTDARRLDAGQPPTPVLLCTR